MRPPSGASGDVVLFVYVCPLPNSILLPNIPLFWQAGEGSMPKAVYLIVFALQAPMRVSFSDNSM